MWWGGFAAEYFLLKNDIAEQGPGDNRDINQVVWHNAIADREDFWERRLGPDESFSESEDREFMGHAIEIVAPIFNGYVLRMQEVVRELLLRGRIDGKRVRELLQIGDSK